MTRHNDDGSSGFPPVNGQADPRWNIYSPPGKGHRNIYTPTLPDIGSKQGHLPSPRRHHHVINTPSMPEIVPKQDPLPRSPRHHPVAAKPPTLPDIRGNRPFEINKARFPAHGFSEEPVEWKGEHKAIVDVVQHRVAPPAHHANIPAPTPHHYPDNVEAARIQAARRVRMAYVDDIRMEASYHFQPVYSEEELRQIDLDRQRNVLLERKDCQAEIFRLMKAANAEIAELEGMHVPAPPSCPKPSGSHASVRARKVKKMSKKKQGEKENKEF